jgi:hypothetical protein
MVLWEGRGIRVEDSVATGGQEREILDAGSGGAKEVRLRSSAKDGR